MNKISQYLALAISAIFLSACAPTVVANLQMKPDECIIFGRYKYECISTGFTTGFNCAFTSNTCPDFWDETLLKRAPINTRKDGIFVSRVKTNRHFLMMIRSGNHTLHLPKFTIMLDSLLPGKVYYVGNLNIGYGKNKESVLAKYPNGKIISDKKGKYLLLTEILNKLEDEKIIIDTLYPNHPSIDVHLLKNFGEPVSSYTPE